MNGPPLLPTDDDKVGTEIQPGVGVCGPPTAVVLPECIAGSAGQSPVASVQGIIAGGDDPEVAILVVGGR